VLYCNHVSISNHFRDTGHSLYLGHDLDLSRSRDVIGHVTNRSAICHLLLVSHWNRTSISNRFRDIWPQNPCARAPHTHRKWFYILSHAMHCIGQTKTAVYHTVNGDPALLIKNC